MEPSDLIAKNVVSPGPIVIRTGLWSGIRLTPTKPCFATQPMCHGPESRTSNTTNVRHPPRIGIWKRGMKNQKGGFASTSPGQWSEPVPTYARGSSPDWNLVLFQKCVRWGVSLNVPCAKYIISTISQSPRRPNQPCGVIKLCNSTSYWKRSV